MVTRQTDDMARRNVVWFSCGAASAVVARLATDAYDDVAVVYCDLLADEHSDNRRFLHDVEEWTGQTVQIIQSPDFTTVDEVFASRRYMAGIHGAPCTVAMKKQPRFAYSQPDDLNLFGFTADEPERIGRFDANNPDLPTRHLLADEGITKSRCYQIIEEAGIELPVMYRLGYRNNNCIGCVKATSAAYWNKVRVDFPEVFDKRASQSREYGARLTRVNGERVFLDELPADYLTGGLENISCGPDCGTQLTL